MCSNCDARENAFDRFVTRLREVGGKAVIAPSLSGPCFIMFVLPREHLEEIFQLGVAAEVLSPQPDATLTPLVVPTDQQLEFVN